MKIIKLSSVTLTREKQDLIERELQKYADAVNWMIRTILKRHIATAQRTAELLQEEFSEKFDSRIDYIRDVIKTARVEIGRHRHLAKTVRTMRDKTPFFKSNRAILSNSIVSVSEKAVTVTTCDGIELHIPFDKRSRNRFATILQTLRRNPERLGRVRLTWKKEGYVDIDIRYIPRQ
jgi:hypothetical protein